MNLDQLLSHLPAAAIAVGLLLFLWGQRERLAGLLARLSPAGPVELSAVEEVDWLEPWPGRPRRTDARGAPPIPNP